jgi:hypothetical protein
MMLEGMQVSMAVMRGMVKTERRQSGHAIMEPAGLSAHQAQASSLPPRMTPPHESNDALLPP